MNKLTYSLLIGFGVTAVCLGIASLLKKNSGSSNYHGHYVLKIHRKENVLMESGKVRDKVIEILTFRLTDKNSIPQIKPITDELIDISVADVSDTGKIPRLVSMNSYLEFREMYTMEQAGFYLSKADELLGYKVPSTEKQLDTKVPDSSFVKYSDSDPPVDSPQQSIFNLIVPSEPYEANQKKQFPSYLGMVRIADTAHLTEELNRNAFAHTLPVDLKFMYGPAYSHSDPQKKEFVYLYAVRAYPGKPPTLDNDDIMTAKFDYTTTGEPEIYFTFNPVATKKWERMTTANVGKPIAMILDNQVISAPNVNSPISGGESSISGGFSVLEATDLALMLNTGMPAKATIVKQEITKESGPLVPGNPWLYLILFAVSAGISYLIIHLLKST